MEVRATALNRVDLLQIRGRYPAIEGESPIPGLECAGVVAEQGPGVSSWPPGSRVMALLAGGGHGERVAAPAGQLMPLPDGLSFAEGAAIPEAGLTAWTNLVAEAGMRAGETVLVSGATGGVGSLAVQIARELGGRVLATGRDRRRLEDLGCGELVVDDESLVDRVAELTAGHGVDVVLDLVGGAALGSRIALLAPGGRLILVGLMGGSRSEVDAARILRSRLRIVGSLLRPRPRVEKAELVAGFSGFALPRLEDGRLAPRIAERYPFERIGEAYAALERGGQVGKIVVERASGTGDAGVGG